MVKCMKSHSLSFDEDIGTQSVPWSKHRTFPSLPPGPMSLLLLVIWMSLIWVLLFFPSMRASQKRILQNLLSDIVHLALCFWEQQAFRMREDVPPYKDSWTDRAHVLPATTTPPSPMPQQPMNAGSHLILADRALMATRIFRSLCLMFMKPHPFPLPRAGILALHHHSWYVVLGMESGTFFLVGKHFTKLYSQPLPSYF